MRDFCIMTRKYCRLQDFESLLDYLRTFRVVLMLARITHRVVDRSCFTRFWCPSFMLNNSEYQSYNDHPVAVDSKRSGASCTLETTITLGS